MRKIFFTLIIITTTVACIRKKSSPIAEPTPASVPQSGAALTLAELDPTKAKTSVQATEVKSEIFGESYKLPYFEITYSGATYVQILRCQEDYRSFLQQAITDNKDRPQPDQKWPWLNSIGNAAFCELASRYTILEKFYDVGAKNGTFFYVLNPCVSAEFSKTAKDECSHNLTLTSKIEYTDSPSLAFAKKAGELDNAESAFDAAMTKYSALSRMLVQQKEQCQGAFDADIANQHETNLYWEASAAAGAVAAGLGARALLSKRVTTSMANNLQKLYSGATKIKSIGRWTSGNKWGIAAVMTAVVVGLAFGLGKTDISTPNPNPACERALQIGEEITKMHNEKVLEKATDKMIAISSELKAMYALFDGYTEASFGPKGKIPDGILPTEQPAD